MEVEELEIIDIDEMGFTPPENRRLRSAPSDRSVAQPPVVRKTKTCGLIRVKPTNKNTELDEIKKSLMSCILFTITDEAEYPSSFLLQITFIARNTNCCIKTLNRTKTIIEKNALWYCS